MKKILSVILAAIMAVSAFAVSVLPAMAAPSPVATTAKPKGPTITVNGGSTTNDVTYSPDPDDENKIDFEYKGDGTVEGWTTNLEELGFVEGVDYTLIENADGSFSIIFLNPEAKKAYEDGKVIINVKVKSAETTTGVTKKDDSSKSPSTGVATSVIAGSIAVAGAGIAVLSATKKRDAE